MKERIKQNIAGILLVPVLALAASVAVMPLAQPASAAPCDIDIAGGAQCAKGDDQTESLTGDTGVFTQITNVLLFIIGAISVIMIIIGGIRYTISNGDSAAITGAKNTIMYAVIGLIVAIIAFAIVNFVLVGLNVG